MVRSSSSSASHAVADHAAVARHGGRFVDERLRERVAHVRQLVDLREQAADERRLQLAQQHLRAGDGGDRLTQRHEVARARRAERGPRDEPLDVVDRS